MIRQSLLVALIALGLAGCNTSYNYFQAEVEEEETDSPGTLFGAMLNRAGMTSNQNRGIEYKPRAPLAMPGSTELPSPDETQSAEASVNFPTDDDDARRERARRADELGLTAAYERQAAGATSNRVSNAGLQALPPTSQTLRRETGGQAVQAAMSGDETARLNRQEMNVTITTPGRKRNKLLTEEGQAMPRQYLVQPPDEYRTPSETAALPEKKDIENSKWVKDRLYKREDKRPARMITE